MNVPPRPDDEARRLEGDLGKAILHIRRALEPKYVVGVWLLAGKLLNENNQRSEAIKLLLEGIGKISVEKNVVELYQSCAELLAQDDFIPWKRGPLITYRIT